MKTNNWGWIPCSLLAAALTVGCQGQNPFKRESNPTKDYSAVNDKETSRKYVPGETDRLPEPQKAPEQPKIDCFEPLEISVKNDRGHNLLEFTEGQEDTYEVTITNRFGQSDYDVKIGKAPEGLTWTLVDKKNKTAIYHLKYKAPKVKSPRGYEREQVALTYESPLAKTCGSEIKAKLDILIARGEGMPNLKLSLPQTAVKYKIGEKYAVFDFNITVDDPASSPETPPVLNPIRPNAAFQSNSPIRSAAPPVVICAEKAVAVPKAATRWQFKCKFHSEALPDVKELIGTGETIEAVFLASATSGATGRSTGDVSGTVRIEFDKASEQKRGN